MLRRVAMLGLLMGLTAPCLAAAPVPDAPPHAGMGTVTREVARYGELEQRLAAALQAHDESAVHALLDDDFDVTAAGAADSQSADDWLEVQKMVTLTRFAIRTLAVRELGTVDIVSFVLDVRGPDRAKQALPHSSFVVDVWRSADGKLLTRYVSVPRSLPPPSPQPDGRG